MEGISNILKAARILTRFLESSNEFSLMVITKKGPLNILRAARILTSFMELSSDFSLMVSTWKVFLFV